ncbi:MAG: lysophospholipid acyltransferase family protein [Patescibacteria group bacterium]
MAYPILDQTLVPLLRRKISRIEGIENVPLKSNFILAANHCSVSDHFYIITSLLPFVGKKIYFISGQNVWQLYGSWVAEKILGMIRKYEDNPARCLEDAKKLLRENHIVGIFPEGTIQKKGLIKGKTGVARLALTTKTPVLPVGYLGLVSPERGIGPFLKDYFSKEPIVIKIGRPIVFNEHYDGQFNTANKELLESVTRKIMQSIGDLIGEEYKY